MYKKLNDFLDKHFPNIEGCILFGSYAEKKEKANDIDLLLISNKFSFSSTESFVHNNFAFNTIKINPLEILNITAKQFKQGNFLAHAFKTGIIIRDKTKELLQIRNYIIGNIPTASADVISFDLSEVKFKIKDYLEPIKQSSNFTTENFLQASKLISLFVDFFLLDRGVYLKTEKSKNKYFFQNFPNEASNISKLIEYLQNGDKINFEKIIAELIFEYSISTNGKYSNNFILDDYTQKLLVCYIENTFKFNEISNIIEKIKTQNIDLKFFIYQIDEENQEKEGCYIVIDNTNLSIEREKKEWIIFFQNIFKDYNFTFPYNNIFCYPEIKFMGVDNELIVNELMFSLINKIQSHKELGKEKIIFRMVKDFFGYSTITIDDLYNFYLIRLDAKAKMSNFLNNNNQKVENKFIKFNKNIENTLIQRFELISERILDFEPIQKIPQLVHLQILDRILSIFLSKDYEKFYYIYVLKHKFNEKVS
ncbi:nucleotidyltransferase domain-containing protein [Chryseobacterium lathyri]|uniref:nucleotidyltransferase domain-containing protein n=1 Tax=Chryseobacterium lathyri TaxID=395933 RepID=UPI001CC1670B|nr:nucleotidyltransferase domain-containing protein [Chryseobacterium lathyri]